MATVEGVVDHVVDVVGGELIAGYPMLTEALRRRRVEAAEADRFVERLFGLELTQATYDRGNAFVAGVLERAGQDGLRRLWDGARDAPHARRGRRPGPLARPHRPLERPRAAGHGEGGLVRRTVAPVGDHDVVARLVVAHGRPRGRSSTPTGRRRPP